MTSQGPRYPSGQPAAYPPVQPPLGPPHSGGGDGRHRRRWAIPLAAVIGLAVGAGIVGGLWLTNRADHSSAPPPVPISLSTLPTGILGQQRDDLAAAASGGEQASTRGKAQADLYTSEIPLYEMAYGGKGIRGTYGIVENKVTYTLLIVNGIQPAPLVASDALITRLQAISPPNPVAAPGSANTQCVAQPGKPIVLHNADALAQAKQQVLDDPESLVTCVRSDRARNVSIQLQGHPLTGTGQSAASRAKTIATEVDRIWATLVS